MNDEKKKKRIFYESHFRVIGFGTGKRNHTDDTRRNEPYDMNISLPLLFPFFTSSSILLPWSDRWTHKLYEY